ncbi:hypothetical protein GVX76_06070, partial [[Haemophilus] felis]|nr:hypothetical protein [[Haemophilus] felis]
MHFQLKVHIKNNAPEIINFQVNNKTPLIIQHSNQEVLFELFDKETQLAPQKLVMKRDGNNLHIFI